MKRSKRRTVAQHFEPNCLYYGDCLNWMREWEDSCVDLIYLDPPFNSNANYSVLFGGKGGDNQAQYSAFNDTWHWDDDAAERYTAFENDPERPAHDAVAGLRRILGKCGMLAYLTYMAERLEQMRRILKPTGSIYLHCDPTASHSLKLLMDAVFGQANFRNEIVWCYTTPSSAKRHFPRKHDAIFFYSKRKDEYIFNHESPLLREPYKRGSKLDGKGWKTGKTYSQDEVNRGKLAPDWWDKFTPVQRLAKERLGYPTQKPLALLKRIIEASSNEGGIVLDPFCGGGTAVEAARRLNRRWAGVDINSVAIDLVRMRLKDESISVKGMPVDQE